MGQWRNPGLLFGGRSLVWILWVRMSFCKQEVCWELQVHPARLGEVTSAGYAQWPMQASAQLWLSPLPSSSH
jgi:hypothetical protein